MPDSSESSYKKGELAKRILLMIAGGLIIPAAVVAPNLALVLRPIIRALCKKHGVQRQNIVKSITYLKRQRLVSIVEKNGQQILTLSENGRKKILQYNLDKITLKKPKRWDGYWRLVIFDIPEDMKRGREAFREKLKHLGFYQLQKSCFVYPYDCRKEIDFITEIFDISPHINFIIAKEIEGQEHLLKFFNLGSQ